MPQSTRTFVIDGYTFPQADIPARGPMISLPAQRWARHRIIGTVQPGDILTFLGFESQSWELTSKALLATKNKLITVFYGRSEVVFKTPEEPSGFNVLMTELDVEYRTPLENSLYLCRFVLIRRE